MLAMDWSIGELQPAIKLVVIRSISFGPRPNPKGDRIIVDARLSCRFAVVVHHSAEDFEPWPDILEFILSGRRQQA